MDDNTTIEERLEQTHMLNTKLTVLEEIPTSIPFLPRKFKACPDKILFIDPEEVVAAVVFCGWMQESNKVSLLAELHFGNETLVAEYDDRLASALGIEPPSKLDLRSSLDSVDEIKKNAD